MAMAAIVMRVLTMAGFSLNGNGRGGELCADDSGGGMAVAIVQEVGVVWSVLVLLEVV